MGKIERIVRLLGRLHGRAHLFVASIILFGALLLGASFVSYRAREEYDNLGRAYLHAIESLDAANEVQLASLNLLRGERGYLLTRQPELLKPFTDASETLDGKLATLAMHLADDPRQRATLATLEGQIAAYLARLNRIVELERRGEREAAMAMVHIDDGRTALRRIEATLDTIVAAERHDIALARHHVRKVMANQAIFSFVISITGLCLLILALLTAIALRRSFARERAYRAELQKQAETDELTGIANRRELMACLDRAIAGARRDGHQLAFALIDIDRFKSVNDRYGHLAGDEVIRKIARTALAAIRGCDVVGRLGGEEFAIILPGADVAQAYSVCERLRARIQAETIELPGGQLVSVTISSGIARLRADDTALTLTERADRALYEAKHGGRDQVRLAA